MKNLIKPSLIFGSFLLLLTNCSTPNRDRHSENLNINFSSPENGGLSPVPKYNKQNTPPNMVYIEGGRFTMGQTEQNLLGNNNNKPHTVHVRSFYLDEAEVTNHEYKAYTDWVKMVFPPDNPKYKYIYSSVLPDEYVWKGSLANDSDLSSVYFTHPAYKDYPVVGVSWLQAKEYCKWRTNRALEQRLIKEKILMPLYNNSEITVEGRNHFDKEVFENAPKQLFEGNYSIYTNYVKPIEEVNTVGEVAPTEEGEQENTIENEIVETEINSNDESEVKLNLDGYYPTPAYRLPTEAEWEYAAKVDIRNKEIDNYSIGRKKFAWKSEAPANQQKKYYLQHANFKFSKGDYSGVAGRSSDFGDITVSVRSYPANSYGLYDMAGNVAEWVDDVYRPTVDSEYNDFNYRRGNVFRKPKIDINGKVIVAGINDIVYDTLPNGNIVPAILPGQVVKEQISGADVYLRNNFQKSDNRDFADGDVASTRDYLVEDPERRKRMYNSPIIPPPVLNEETGELEFVYDDKARTSQVTNYSRVYKGGSWKDRGFWLDPSQRRFLEEYMSENYIGFRCAVGIIGENHTTKNIGTRGRTKRGTGK